MRKLVTGMLLALAGPTALVGQGRFEIGFEAGAAFPVEKLVDADLKTGVGFEGVVNYRFLPHLAVYAGWDWRRFSTDLAGGTSFVGSETDIEETGYVLGLRFEHPLGGPGLPWLMVKGGATLAHLEIEDGDGDSLADTGHGVGWEAGVGLAVPVREQIRVVPALRFRSLARELQIGGVTRDARLRFLSVEVGVRWAL